MFPSRADPRTEMYSFGGLGAKALLNELTQFSSLIIWSIFPPLLAPRLHALLVIARSKLGRASTITASDIIREKKACHALVLAMILVVMVGRNVWQSEKSFFREMGYKIGCEDKRIRREYHLYLKRFHPDKAREVPVDFEYKKSMFELLKDHDRCIKYDIFGVERGDVKVVPKTEKEWFTTFMIETGVFYAAAFALFFGLPVFFRPSDEFLEALLFFLLAMIFDIEGVVNYRSGIVGFFLSVVEKFTGHLSLFEARGMLRSTIFTIMIFCRHMKALFQERAPNYKERCGILAEYTNRLKRAHEKLSKAQ